ncbi:MAG TPA: carotenoid oxygenase family protein, partial [Leptolyngbyaceae cyanobacterium]
ENAVYSYLVNLIPQCSYSIYRMDAHSNQRQLVGSVPIKRPAYMHTFGMTEHYIVLTEFPLLLSRFSLALSGKPIIENYDWKPEEGTRFLIISKADGSVHTCQSEAFFAFHHVNAFEQDGEVMVDLVTYPDSSVIQSLYLEPLLNHPEQVIAAGELRRYRVPLQGKTVTYEVITSEPIELPRINYPRCNTRNYEFAYGVGNSQPGNFIDQLVKVNVQDGTTRIWRSPDCYPGEPVFVAAPKATSEDEGVILSVVLNAQTEASFLLVLDAGSFEELARAQVPYPLPFDFHGQYFDAIAPTQRSQLHR